MKRTALLSVIAAAWLGVQPAAAQNRLDQQVLLELRTLTAQVQQLQLAVNRLADGLKKSDGRIDQLTNDLLTGFANQKLLIDALTTQQRTLNERESDGSVRVQLLAQEMKEIRKGLDAQQKMLDEIIGLLKTTPPAGTGTGDPTAPPPTPPPSGRGSVPASPNAIYDNARNYYLAGQWDFAIATLEDAIKRFPDAVQAAEAQWLIGNSHRELGRTQEALAAYTLVIEKYKDRDPAVIADAYVSQGLAYEKLGQKPQAIKSWETVKSLFPGSSSALIAEQNLKRIK